MSLKSADLSYIRPEGAEISKFPLPYGQTLPEDDVNHLVNWFAFNLMTAIINGYHNTSYYEAIEFTVDYQNGKADKLAALSHYDGNVNVNRKTVYTIKDRAIEIATSSLGISRASIESVSPAKVNLKIKEKIQAPFIKRVVPTPHALSESLYPMFLANDLTDMAFTANGQEIPCHKLVLKARSKEAFETRLSDDKIVSKYSSIAVKALLEFIYTDNVVDLPENVEDALALVELGHEFNFPNLQILGSVVLSQKVTLDTFLRIDASAQNRNLGELSKFLQTKVALNFSFKNEVDLRIVSIIDKKLLDLANRQAKHKKVVESLNKIETVAIAYHFEKALTALKDAKITISTPEKKKSLAEDSQLF